MHEHEPGEPALAQIEVALSEPVYRALSAIAARARKSVKDAVEIGLTYGISASTLPAPDMQYRSYSVLVTADLRQQINEWFCACGGVGETTRSFLGRIAGASPDQVQKHFERLTAAREVMAGMRDGT